MRQYPRDQRRILITLLTIGALVGLGQAVTSPASAEPAAPVSFTVLHTNDFHGNLEPSGSNPGAARVAAAVNGVRTAVGAANTLLLDGGDMMQGSLLSNLQKGAPTIAYYRTLGYNAATFGNHEFDWGQTTLGQRIDQAEAPAGSGQTPMSMIVSNITTKDAGGACTWAPFNPAVAPYEVFTVGTEPNQVRVGVIGVGSVETPYITIAAATAGLCFRDPAESIIHYYDELKAASDVQIVLSHNGFTDGGYGYGFPVYGDQTLAQRLIDAGKPVPLIIGGHSHTNVSLPAPVVGGQTTVVQAYYAGRQVGRADLTFNPDTDAVAVNWSKIAVSTTGAQDPTVQALINSYTSDPTYQALINQPVGYSQVDLLRDYNGDNMMGDFVDDAIYGALNEDGTATNDVDMFFNNAGGIRTDWCDKEDPANPGAYIWSSLAADCQKEGVWTHDPMLLTYGNMFQILPFGNATAVGTMTGAQIYDLLDQSATLFKGAIQPSGIRFKFYRYSDANPGPQPYAWGAYDAEVFNRSTHVWEPLDMSKTYHVGTNEFLAPAGQDGYAPFKYMKDISYWGDMLDSVNAYVSAHYSLANPYQGPDGDGTLDARIARNGTDAFDQNDPSQIVPITVLHHNDSHGRLVPVGSYQGYDQLATIIKQERAHNPQRTLVLSAGDNIQGDSMMYYFKSAGLGYAADGTALPADLQINPLIKAMNAVGYDAMTLGNHEFNFGSDIFKTLAKADFPILGANVSDTGSYGLSTVGVEPYVTKTLGPEHIKVALLGITNHRVPSYELPSNIPGLTFTDPIAKGEELAPTLQANNDAVIALTHIGFTEDPKSVEVDANVDTAFAAQVSGVDAVIGGHSHTNPVTGFGAYKYLPAFIAGPGNVPVPVTQAYRYNTNLGEITLGMLPDGQGGYRVVARSGRYVPVPSSTVEDPDIKALVQPYQDLINTYNNTVIGQTTTPIDTLQAFTTETNGANLQADASVWKLEHEGIPVDVHLSGAMTNKKIAGAATPDAPYTLKVSDMFDAMPYENSLVVLNMNGPQLKAVLERAYRNYYYYNHVPGYGGYSYYTTCMLDTDKGNQIVYRDTYPTLPDGNNVLAFKIGGQRVDFSDASTYYRVSTVNYLAAGACNFSDAGTSLWPLNQIAADTQYYVRDAVTEYIQAQTDAISPAIEGRIAYPLPPVVSTPAVTPEPSYEAHEVTASADFADTAAGSAPYSCTVDYGDGTGPVAGTVNASRCTGPAHSYAHFGSYPVTVTVMDDNGWVIPAATTHAVRFNFTGFFPPLATLPADVRAGSALPVKFSLGGSKGMRIFAGGYPQLQRVSCTNGAPVGSPISRLVGGLGYRAGTGTYTYLLKTPKVWRGWCADLNLKLVDGSTHTAQVRFAG